MKVAAAGVSDSIRATLDSWGWQISGENPDAMLTTSGQQVEIRIASTVHADEIVFLPLQEAELRFRIELAQARQARLSKRLHDLRSPLNAIQGYAEMIEELVEGDALRFASNIRTASEILLTRLESIRDEGV